MASDSSAVTPLVPDRKNSDSVKNLVSQFPTAFRCYERDEKAFTGEGPLLAHGGDDTLLGVGFILVTRIGCDKKPLRDSVAGLAMVVKAAVSAILLT